MTQYTSNTAKLLVENAVSFLSIEARLKSIQVEVYNYANDCYEIVSNELTINLENQLQIIVNTAALAYNVSVNEIIGIINLVSEFSPLSAKVIMSEGWEAYEKLTA